MATALTGRQPDIGSTDLRLVQSPVMMSARDQRVFSLDTEDYGGTPTTPTAIVTNLATDKSVTALVLSGSAAVSGDVITWPTIQNLVAGQEYAVDFEFTCAGQRYQRRLIIYTVI